MFFVWVNYTVKCNICNKRHPDGHPCNIESDLTHVQGLMTPCPGQRILPRAKKVSPGHFFTLPSVGSPSSNPIPAHKKYRGFASVAFVHYGTGLRPHGPQSAFHGFSPGLKKCPPDTFLPSLRSGRPLRIPFRSIKNTEALPRLPLFIMELAYGPTGRSLRSMDSPPG